MRRVLRYLAILMIVAAVMLGTVVPVQAALAITTVNPAIGTVGSNITVSGTTDAANGSTVTISYDTTDVTTTTVTAGAWSKAFAVPASVAGAHDITATVGADTDTTSFTVRPKIAVTQPAGGVTITGSGFGDTESITINIDTTQGVSTATTDVNGSFSITGLSVEAGSHTFEAISADASHNATATFTVVSHSTIALGKTSGPVGTSVTINGAGFAANETNIMVTFDGSQIGATTRASSTGAWTLTFTIPTAAGGPHSVDASGATTSATSITEQTFNITAVITLKPTSASPGATVTVTGSGFAANETGINLTYDSEPIGTSAAASANGTFTTTFKVPAGSAGTHTIDASGSSTSTASVPDVTFKVGAGISINKSSGGAGTSVTVTGSGFAANESDIAVTYDGQDVGSKVTANATGSWSSTFVIPASPAGAHTISASGPTTAAVTAHIYLDGQRVCTALLAQRGGGEFNQPDRLRFRSRRDYYHHL